MSERKFGVFMLLTSVIGPGRTQSNLNAAILAKRLSAIIVVTHLI